MTIHARSQIVVVERNDDQEDSICRRRERGWHRAENAKKIRFYYYYFEEEKGQGKNAQKKSLQLPHTKTSSQKETCRPKTLPLLDPQQQQRSSLWRRFFASQSNSPLPGRRSISTTRSPGRYCTARVVRFATSLFFFRIQFFRVSRDVSFFVIE